MFIDCSQYLFLLYESVGGNFIPGGVTGNFHRLNPFGRTVALRPTQPRTEMNLRDASWGKKRPVHRADKVTTFICLLSRNSGTLNLL